MIDLYRMGTVRVSSPCWCCGKIHYKIMTESLFLGKIPNTFTCKDCDVKWNARGEKVDEEEVETV